jgi:hypothetical protein
MFLRGYQKFFGALLLVPVVFLFVACCCLTADAAVQKKSKCSSCPQKEKSNHQTDCPHAKIRAITGADAIESNSIDHSYVTPILVSSEVFFSPRIFQLVSFKYYDTSQQHSSLFPQNPILRL